MLDSIQQEPDIAEAVLTAPRAHVDSTPLTLGKLYGTLPDKLFAAAARGFFGATAVEWRLNATDAPTCTRTLQLLPRQPCVTAVRLVGSAMHAQLHELVGGVALATQLTAVSLVDSNSGWGIDGSTYRTATDWLHPLEPLTGLKRLDLCGCLLPAQSLLVADATLVQLQQLTALMLDCAFGQGAEADGAAANLAPALLLLTKLSELGLRKLSMGRAGVRALGGALAGLPSLCSLDLFCTVKAGPQPDDPDFTGVAACTALTKPNLTRCWLSARSLCAVRARLLSLTLNGNFSLHTAGVCSVLAAPSLPGLTRLSLANVGMHAEGVWPWRQLCALTKLQDLNLMYNQIGDAGASALALCVSAIVQLRRLDISNCGLTVPGPLAHALWRLPRLRQLACKQWAPPMVQPFEMPADARARGRELVARIKEL